MTGVLKMNGSKRECLNDINTKEFFRLMNQLKTFLNIKDKEIDETTTDNTKETIDHE